MDDYEKSKLLGINKVYLDFFTNLAEINGNTLVEINRLYLDGFKQIRLNNTDFYEYPRYLAKHILPTLIQVPNVPSLNLTYLMGPQGFSNLGKLAGVLNKETIDKIINIFPKVSTIFEA